MDSIRARTQKRIRNSEMEELRFEELNEIQKNLDKRKKQKEMRVVKRRIKYIIVMVNTNEKFLETTFYLLGTEKKMLKSMGVKFGYSMVVFPRKNYIFKSISYTQPKMIRKPMREAHNLNFEFLPIEDNVISLELNDIVRDLFVKNDKYVYQNLAEYLYKINLIFGRINDYVYRGSLSQKVVEIFLKKAWESEICNNKSENDFHLIRDWANKEFEDPDVEEDDHQDIEREYRMDGQTKKTNIKVTESYLIPIPRDENGKVVPDELDNLNDMKKKSYCSNRRRVSFFNRGVFRSKKNSRRPSKRFKSNVTKTSGLPSHQFNSETYKTNENVIKNIKNKYKVEAEIKEESRVNSEKSSNDGNINSVRESYDSHSDSDVFDPNEGDFTDNSFISQTFDFTEMNENFDMMIVLDRSNDLVTPFVTQSSYMGVLDDLLKGTLLSILLE